MRQEKSFKGLEIGVYKYSKGIGFENIAGKSPYNPRVRAKQAEKRHFCDPALACALLKAAPERLIGDLETFGFLFEALVERDLKIYAESFGANVFHYQDYIER